MSLAESTVVTWLSKAPPSAPHWAAYVLERVSQAVFKAGLYGT